MKRTVFVIGAGASAEFGLPIGAALAAQIRDALDDDFGERNLQNGPVAMALLRNGGLVAEHVTAGRELRGALLNSRSIDHALYARRNRPLVVEIGKLAIVAEILRGERDSPLSRCSLQNANATYAAVLEYRDGWLAELVRLAISDRQPDELNNAFDNISFVTFNYDRCIEQFLFFYLQAACGKTADEATGLVRNIPIHHVYGMLSGFTFGGRPQTDFASSDDYIPLMSRNVRTYTEGVEQGSLDLIRGVVQAAEQVIFLGFGYDPMNVAALFPERAIQGQALWGTMRVDDLRKTRFCREMFQQDDLPPDTQQRVVGNDCSGFMQALGPRLFEE